MKNNRRQLLTTGMACLAGIATPKWQASAATESTPRLGRPNSKINGVQIGVISYSFRSLPDQSAEAVLRYCRQLGINAVELMGDPAEAFAGIALQFDNERFRKVNARSQPGQPPLTPSEQQEHDEVMAARADYKRQLATLRTKASMRPFEQLRQLYHDAGVSIYAFKPATFELDNTDAEIDYGMRAARALGADHVTVEMPTDPSQTSRLGSAAMHYGLRVAYHAHLQATPTLWDAALAQSPANAINFDIGHFVAADAFDPIAFIRQKHERIASMHMKDRQTRSNGQQNLSWGHGDTPLVAALQLMRERQYRFPAAIEFEYDVPAGSDALIEVGKCLDYCRAALRLKHA
jgi:sugar phosphate isomerase/epimerase